MVYIINYFMFASIIMDLFMKLKNYLAIVFFLMNTSLFAQSGADSLELRIAQLDSAHSEESLADLFQKINISIRQPISLLLPIL